MFGPMSSDTRSYGPSVLWVEGSPKGDRSLSSACARAFLASVQERAPLASVEHLDVWTAELPEFGGEAAVAKFAPLFGEALTEEQQRLWSGVEGEIERRRSADLVVVSSPMWNWSIQIKVSNLERSLEFYQSVGFDLISQGVVTDAAIFEGLGLPAGTLRGAFLRVPGTSTRVTPILDMIEFVDPQPCGGAYPALNHIGINRLCFQVAELDEAVQRLRSLGIELVGSIADVVNRRMSSRFVCFRDPDGIVLEFVEVTPRPASGPTEEGYVP